MAKMCLHIFCAGNIIRLNGEEEYLRKVMAVYANAKNGGHTSGVITGGNFVVSFADIQGMTLSPCVEQMTEQEKYFKNARKQISEADWWKGEGEQ